MNESQRITGQRLGALKYSRPYTLAIEALHTLCCTPGVARERLAAIDPEFFCLRPDDFPEEEEVRKNFVYLKELVSRLEPRHPGEGTIPATLAKVHHSKINEMTQLLWELYQGFHGYMNRDA